MLDHTLAQLAFWNRALSVVVATTGSTSLSATSLGFARGAGSFITDGFAAGMEVVGTGFSAANNAKKIITDVTAGFLAIDKTLDDVAVQSATAGRTLSVGLPQARQRDNTIIPNANAPGVRPYIAEQWVPATNYLITMPAQLGHLEETGLYILTWYGLANTGILALRREVEALKALFTPGTTLQAGSNAVSVRGNPGPVAGQVIPLSNGYATLQLVIPWRSYTQNVIAA